MVFLLTERVKIIDKMTAVNLPPELLLEIFSYLESPKDLITCSGVCKTWSFVVSDPSVWLKWCMHFWIPLPNSNEKENAKEKDKERFSEWSQTPMDVQKQSKQAFVQWYQDFEGFHESYARVKACAFRLTQWLRSNCASTFLTLMSGRTGQDWCECLEYFRTIAPYPFRRELAEFVLFYHFIDGQKPRMPHVDAGLFGTFTCYGQYTSLFMLPSKYCKLERISGLKLLVFAVCPRSGKFLSVVVDIPNDESQNLLYQVIEIDKQKNLIFKKGTFLDWMEKYTRELEERNYDVTEPDGAISMFPNRGPYTSLCITNDVEIIASSMYQMETGSQNYIWVYRIRMRRLVDAPCQLIARRWVITYESGHIESVPRSEGVVGQYPELSKQSPSFSYCSICTGRTLHDNSYDLVVSMEGELTFITGSIANPTGPQFNVTIERFNLPKPQPSSTAATSSEIGDLLDW